MSQGVSIGLKSDFKLNMKETISSKHEPNSARLLSISNYPRLSDDYQGNTEEEEHQGDLTAVDTHETHSVVLTNCPEFIDIIGREGPTEEEEHFLRTQIEEESLNLLRTQLIETLDLSDNVMEHHVIERGFRLSPTQSPQHEEVGDGFEYVEMDFESSISDREELQKYHEREEESPLDEANIATRNRLLIERFLDLDTPKLSIKMIDFISDDRVLKLFMGYLTQIAPVISGGESIREDLDNLAFKRSLNVVNVLCSNTPSCRKLFQNKFEVISKFPHD
jgi:hypothetical protein